MKKFLMIVLAVWLIIPQALAYAEDVPDFSAVTGVRLRNSQRQSYGNLMFFYQCNLNADLSNDFAGMYMNFLMSRYNFRLYDQKHEVKGRGSWTLDEWYFVYTGNKQAWWPNENYHFKIIRKRFGPNAPIDANTAQFDLEIAQNLVYGNQSAAPSRRSSNGQRECVACGGSGRCHKCSGSGYYYTWEGGKQVRKSCGYCLASGRCSDCGGRGYR